MALYRKVDAKLEEWYRNREKQALLVDGARQTGKTFSIRAFGKSHFRYTVEINFLENKDAKGIFESSPDARAFLSRISLLTHESMVPGETLIFFDEVQECPEIVTAIKFLAEDGNYRFVMSGSLLGIELKDIRSVPVGYMDVVTMYPLDFEEFLVNLNVSRSVIDTLHESYEKVLPVDEFVNKKILDLYTLYLLVGGMPEAVDEYLSSNNLRNVTEVQQSIIRLYKKDISKYDPSDKLYIEEIYDLIPAELNAKNKRFILKNLNENFKFSRYENSFLWLKDAGAAIPVYCCDEPKSPLMLSRATNLFKLFLSDVGLLSAMYSNGIQLRILQHDLAINFGAVFENAVAQELLCHGFIPYYYNNSRRGEVDFLIEENGHVLPVEVKSGKDYTRHNALSNLMSVPSYALDKAVVLAQTNVQREGDVIYFPVYMTMFMQKEESAEQIYHPDLSGLS